jgi:aryl-alcohol dehydrogenase-like predicted oxidoreductase
MRYRSLGDTGLKVSEISLGTAEIGLDYGFKGNAHYSKPDAKESIRLLHAALDHGINLIDTARVYGNGEEIIGQALEGMTSPPYIASKVFLTKDAVEKPVSALHDEIFSSIEASLRALRLEALDLLLIHNTALKHLERGEILACLEEAQQQGKVRFLGASCYGEETPMAVLKESSFRVLQVPFNLLDQTMNHQVFPEAVAQKVGILVRSAYLRGVLTNQVHSIPERLAPLRSRAFQGLGVLEREVKSLPEAALRFCLSLSAVSSVVIGVKSVAELEANLADASQGILPEELMPALQALSFEGDPIVDPRNWQDLI